MDMAWDASDPSQLRINSAGLTRCGLDWSWDTARSPWSDQDLWVVLDGVGVLYTSTGAQPVRRGSCFVLRGGERYRGEQDRRRRLVVSHTHFDALDSGGTVLRPPPVPLPFHREIADLSFLEGCLHRLLSAYLTAPDGLGSRRWLGCALAVLAEVDAAPQGGAGEQARRIAAVCEAMRQEPALSWSVAAQARRCRWHPDHYARVFAQLRGCGPQEYAIRLRCELAAARLRSDDASIGEVAAALGYADPRFFSRQFRQRFGRSPRTWREGG